MEVKSIIYTGRKANVSWLRFQAHFPQFEAQLTLMDAIVEVQIFENTLSANSNSLLEKVGSSHVLS